MLNVANQQSQKYWNPSWRGVYSFAADGVSVPSDFNVACVCVCPDKIWRVALSATKHTLSIMLISICKEYLNSPLTRKDRQKTWCNCELYWTRSQNHTIFDMSTSKNIVFFLNRWAPPYMQLQILSCMNLHFFSLLIFFGFIRVLRQSQICSCSQAVRLDIEVARLWTWAGTSAPW